MSFRGLTPRLYALAGWLVVPIFPAISHGMELFMVLHGICSVCQNQSSVGHLTDKPLDMSVPSDQKQNCDMLTLFVESNRNIKVTVFNIYHN